MKYRAAERYVGGTVARPPRIQRAMVEAHKARKLAAKEQVFQNKSICLAMVKMFFRERAPRGFINFIARFQAKPCGFLLVENAVKILVEVDEDAALTPDEFGRILSSPPAASLWRPNTTVNSARYQASNGSADAVEAVLKIPVAHNLCVGRIVPAAVSARADILLPAASRCRSAVSARFQRCGFAPPRTCAMRRAR